MSEKLTDTQHAEKIRKLISDLGYAIADAQNVGLKVRCILGQQDTQEPISAQVWRPL